MNQKKNDDIKYNPVKDGIEKETKLVSYSEAPPSASLKNLVHCYWELKTSETLPKDFIYHVIPDACVNLLFNQIDTNITAITALQTNHRELNLGRNFHYVGIQLLPGVWQGNPNEIQNDLVEKPYVGELSLIEVNNKLKNMDFFSIQDHFSKFVEELTQKELIKPNSVINIILENLEQIQSVSDMSDITKLSTRQLQRKIKHATNLSPHDFLKILRIQQTFRDDYLDYYADQSHFIKSFKKLTGYTPEKYNIKFNV